MLDLILSTVMACIVPYAAQQLGSPVWCEREMAQSFLAHTMNVSHYLQLRDLKSSQSTLEARRRIEILMEGYEEILGDRFQVNLYGRPYPQISRLPRNYFWNGYSGNDIIREYQKSAGGCYQVCVGPFVVRLGDYQLATKLWIDDKIRLDIKEALKKASDEKTFQLLMEERMTETQGIIDDLQMSEVSLSSLRRERICGIF